MERISRVMISFDRNFLKIQNLTTFSVAKSAGHWALSYTADTC